jgi:hypothetical protein
MVRSVLIVLVMGAAMALPDTSFVIQANGPCIEGCCDDPDGTRGTTCGTMDDPICCEPSPAEASCSGECGSYCSEAQSCPA